MIGTSWIREHGLQDALLVEALRQRGLDDVPLWTRKFPERDAAIQHWNDLTPLRDGPVSPERVAVPDPAAMSADIKGRAAALGAADTGMTALRPEFIELGVELDYQNVIAVICHEDYAKSLESPEAVDLEAMSTYAKCADIATELARQIRDVRVQASEHEPTIAVEPRDRFEVKAGFVEVAGPARRLQGHGDAAPVGIELPAVKRAADGRLEAACLLWCER